MSPLVEGFRSEAYLRVNVRRKGDTLRPVLRSKQCLLCPGLLPARLALSLCGLQSVWWAFSLFDEVTLWSLRGMGPSFYVCSVLSTELYVFVSFTIVMFRFVDGHFCLGNKLDKLSTLWL